MKHLGIDIGSTTIKYVVTDENGSRLEFARKDVASTRLAVEF